MAKPLDERIKAALGNGARAATVAELIAELTDVIDASEVEQQLQQKISVSLETDEAAGEIASVEAARLAAKTLRLAAKREALEARHQELLSSERRKRLEQQHAGVKVIRDELAAEISARWPDLIAEVVDLLSRLQANDDECAAINRQRAYGLEQLVSAEIIARGCGPSFEKKDRLGITLAPLTQMRIPVFHVDEADIMVSPIWPPKETGTLLAAASANARIEQRCRA